MTATMQDFVVFAGAASQPFWTVVDASGAPIDISTVSEIRVQWQRDAESPVVLTKLFSSIPPGIAFVTNGADGKFKAIIATGDTTGLTGFYMYLAQITDSQGNVTPVAIGRTQVAVQPQWTYSGDPNYSQKDSVRYLIGDIDSSDQQVMDPEILWALTQRANIYGAGALVAASYAARLSRAVDTVDREMRTQYSQKARNYWAVASALENLSKGKGGAMPYAGGISIADKISQQDNPDRVTPQFQIGMMDDLIPVFPAGNETQVSDEESIV